MRSNLRSVPNSGTSRRATVSNTGSDAKSTQDLPRGSANSDVWNTTINQDSITRTSPSDAGTTSLPVVTSVTELSIKLLSAKPVREALGRIDQAGGYLDKLLDVLDKDTEHIFIAVGGTVRSGRLPGGSLLNGTISYFESGTFLEVKGGQRVPLKEFMPARNAIIGGIFVFPRMVDGKPLINPESGEIRFQTMLNNRKLIARYKVKDLMFAGELAY